MNNFISDLPCDVCLYRSKDFGAVTYHPELDEDVNHKCNASQAYRQANFPYCCIPVTKYFTRFQ